MIKARTTFQRRRTAGIPNKKTPAITAPPPNSGLNGASCRSRDAAVVLMARVAVCVVVPLTVTEVGLMEQVIAAVDGAEHAKVTVPLKPLRPSTLIVEVADPPGADMLATFANTE